MTDHTDLSRRLAHALGYHPESVWLLIGPNESFVMVYRLGVFGHDFALKNSKRETWMPFDYNSPTVCLPLIEWLMREHSCMLVPGTHSKDYAVLRSGCEDHKQIDVWADTIAEAVARAVIAVKEG